MKLHSRVDLITNSSTEAFIFDTSMSERDVERLCDQLFGPIWGGHATRSRSEIDNVITYYGYAHGMYEVTDKTMAIIGDSDNSIDYDNFDAIENTFRARRYHLG